MYDLISNPCSAIFQAHRDLSSSKVLTGDQEFQPEAKWELLLGWETKAQKRKDLFRVTEPNSGKANTNHTPEVSLHPPILPSSCAFLCIFHPAPGRLGWGSG